MIEDDPRIPSALVRDLRGSGHTVSPLGLGLEALAAVAQAPVDVVVLDLGLPDIDGAQWLRMFRGVCDAPVVVGQRPRR